MAHEFRAEVQRTNIWRTRIDVTTNWAVVVTGVSISIAFSQPNTHHGVIILNALLITLQKYSFLAFVLITTVRGVQSRHGYDE